MNQRSAFFLAGLAFFIFLSACSDKKSQVTQLPGDDSISNKGFTTPLQYDGYNAVWQDEFDGSGVDAASWTFETGNSYNGWGNHELEFYTGRKENADVHDGYLVITARKEDYNGQQYTSARMITKGKRDFLYGRFDIRARLPQGKGIWPALWMLGSNIDSVGWPACGETDIMELLGHSTDTVYGTIHWGTAPGQHDSKGGIYKLPSGTFADEFHVFSLVWDEDAMKILVDDQEYFSMTRNAFLPAQYPFNKPQHFLFNVAVGGDWPGSPDVTTVFPQKMIVDYIRVFQKK